MACYSWREDNMKIKWLLSMTVGIMSLLGADSENQTTAGKPPVVRTVEFKNFRGVSVKEIVHRLNDRDIQLVERPYSAQYVATARGIVEELMAEKGHPGIHVKPTVTNVQAHAVRVTFTAAPWITPPASRLACGSHPPGRRLPPS